VFDQRQATLGWVMRSSSSSHRIAEAASLWHIVALGCKEPHTAGRSGRPNKAQRLSGSKWGQGTPAGLPWGKPGMGLLMDGAMQQAPQWARHSKLMRHCARSTRRRLRR
jgi:hypothetical protein